MLDQAAETWPSAYARATDPLLTDLELPAPASPPCTAVSRVDEGALLATQRSAAAAWNQTLLDVAYTTRAAKTITARALSALNEAMFMAWGRLRCPAIATALPPCRTLIDRRLAAHPAALEAAVGAAAAAVLTSLFPGESARFKALCEQRGLTQPHSPSDQLGLAVGEDAARIIIAKRLQDASNQFGDLGPGLYTDHTGYTPINSAADILDLDRWQPLRTVIAEQTFLSPHWSELAPYALSSASQFMPAPPLSIYDVEMTTQMHELIVLSGGLTEAHKLAIEYWVNEAESERSPGTWIRFAQLLSYRQQFSLTQDIKLFHTLSQALHDTTIACWKAKRTYDYVRPVSAIRTLYRDVSLQAWAGPYQGTTAITGQHWQPYVTTPATPEYVCEHSALGYAAARVLAAFNDNDAFTFSDTWENHPQAIESELMPAHATLNWHSFSDAAREAAFSTRLSGIHFEHGDLAGRCLGEKVANRVLEVVRNSLDYHPSLPESLKIT